MHERPEFDAADLTAMMTKVARLCSQADDLQAAYLSQESARQAHVCALLSASLAQSLDHLALLCAPVREDPTVREPTDNVCGSGSSHCRAALGAPSAGAVPELFRSARYLRPRLVDTVVGDTLLPGRPHAPRDLVLPPDEPVRGRGHEELAVPPPRARAGLLASAEWHLDTDEIRWSDEMYQIFDRDPVLGPLRLDDLPGHVLPGDLAHVATMVDALLNELIPVDGEFRILRADATVRSVHLVGEPVLDGDGNPRSVWVIIRDVTELRWTQAALSEARRQLVVQRQLARDEHRIAAELQRVVMPRWTRAVSLPGLDVATCYFPADAPARVGGDWYDGLAMSDGTVLLTLGDMAGHGLAAAAGMTTLRSALEGFAVTGATPGEMLYWLNRLLLHTMPAEAIATALCGRYEPERRILTWARAGHPAPLLFRGGQGIALEPPTGMVLGVHDEPSYADVHLELQSGDLLLLFTDGLVERRGHDMDDAITAMLGLGPMLAAGDARSCVDLVVSRLGSTDYEDDACLMAVRVT